jgi:molybdopterin converting factor small subunit
MALVMLRAPLSELAGGRHHPLPGQTVLDVLTALEREHPRLAGWVLDERRRIRTHVNVYVNGQPAQESDAVRETDHVHVLPAITGGER